ncbi:putative RusA family protein [Megasphaera sp. BL7]|uniref:RusA family crossover junction endodeoxyribonuclease n=1 Tax=unclassified Megasphaera TaxID=2626256 RepID=UPI00035735CD|nr:MULTISPECIES: RusA family crossover junction endodeoxyribonuclease [unclassified Megasphaera]EPP15858.1 putative RusA family protein [Megasphaera sp. BL7]EPP18941.1 putative RusA family protein [Megasphaera sp. NM10]
MVYNFTIDGRPMTKKNSMTKTRYGLIQSKQYRDYEKAALCQLMTQKPRGFRTIDCATRMNVEYYMPNRKGWPDLFGLIQATADILEKAGIVEDDGYIADAACSCIAGVDPVWPRAEIKIIPMPDDKLNELHPKLRKKVKK